MAQQLLEGQYENIIDVKEGVDSKELRELRAENRRLDEALRNVRNELGQAIADKQNLERSIQALRNQLSPLHRYLRALFGEIELAIGEEDSSRPQPSQAADGPATPAANNSDPRWESYKQTFPGAASRIIDALLAHPQLTYTQISKLIRSDYNTVKNAAAKLKQAGALVKDGTMCRLNR
jgi:hypothetical protein